MPRPAYFHRPAMWKDFTICGVLFLCYLASATSAAPIDLSSLSCIHSEWVNVIEFFLVNYVAHAATVPSWPGAKMRKNLEWIFVTLLLPFSGLANSLTTIAHQSYHLENDVDKAIGAKAIVVAFPKKLNKVEIFGYDVQDVKEDEVHIHGLNTLPEGYILVRPKCYTLTAIIEKDLENTVDIKLTYSRSLGKMSISVGQLFFGCITLYRARGDQIDKYGYAAYGLTVFPYVFMSLINLLHAGLVGNYPSVYLLNTRLIQGEENQRKFPGVVGILKKSESDDSVCDYKMTQETPWGHPHTRRTSVYMAGTLILHTIPSLFILSLTRFKKQQSTTAERAWTMAWLGASQLAAFILGFIAVTYRELYTSVNLSDSLLTLALFIILSPAAIGGFVVVGKMIMEDGPCGVGQSATV